VSMSLQSTSAAVKLPHSPSNYLDWRVDSLKIPATIFDSRYDVRFCKPGGSMAKRKRSVLAWTKEDVKNLRTLAKERLSGTQAAKRLRRTPGAVAQKAMKLGIRFRSIRRKPR
jgi:hypothetical protein